MILINGRKIIIRKGDITHENSEAIVNPANNQLIHGGGAARAIALAGGAEVQRESDEIVKRNGAVPTGSAVITTGGQLPAKYIIHTVGPRMGEGDEDVKLKQAVESVLRLAEKYNLSSVSMPAISSGIYGFHKERCAEILLDTTITFLQEQANSLDTIVMCNFDDETYQIFLAKARVRGDELGNWSVR